jgi:predicted O-methyltransferase YrrM
MHTDLPLPDSAWSLTREALALVETEIRRRRPRRVVELGCGVSTLALGRVMREQGGELHSLEHDVEWARSVEMLVAEDGSAPSVQVEVAALEPNPAAFGAGGWYASRVVERLPDGIGLLLIDGPPGNEPGRELSRYPALPALAPRLARGALIVLDDAARPGEREIVRRWESEYPMSFDEAAGGRLAVAEWP